MNYANSVVKLTKIESINLKLKICTLQKFLYMYSINIIGAGNVAYRMALFLQAAGYSVECVCARSLEKADIVVRALKRGRSNAFATDDFSSIPISDITIIAVSDNAIKSVALQSPHNEATVFIQSIL